MLLKNKVALITGAAQGIGQGIAALFAAEGATVVLTDIQEEKARDSAGQIEKDTGQPAKAIKLDVADPQGIRDVVGQVEKEYNRLDILVNNAGIQEWVPFLETSEELWDRHYQVNVKGTFLLCQAGGRIMVRQKSGKIVNLSSDSGVAPVPDGAAAYCSSKSAIIGLTRVIARELGPHGVFCNAICPGAVNTPMTERFLKTAPPEGTKLEDWANLAALKKVAEPLDIARVALFLASPLSDHVTGEHLLVTGGDIMSQ